MGSKLTWAKHISNITARAGQRLNAERDPLMCDIDGMDLDYPGPYAMPFQEAVALWWIGKVEIMLRT